MHKYNLALAVGLLFSTANVWALEAMSDGAMAEQTGQDGITVALQYTNSTISFSEAIITDTNGMAGATGKASLVIAPQTFSSTQGIRFFKDISSTTLATAPINIKMDAEGNAGTPVLNAAISLPSDMQRIRINPFSIYLATGSDSIFTQRKIDSGTNSATNTNLYRAGVTELLRVNGEGIDTIFKSGDAVTINVQLGNTPQGHMFMFTGGSILCIANNGRCMANPTTLENANPIELISTNSSGNSSLKLNFKLTASNQVTGFRLNGFYGDINADGLTFGKVGVTDKLDLVLSNITAGCSSGCQDINTFNNLKNGSIGNLGIVGASVTNLKVHVRGL